MTDVAVVVGVRGFGVACARRLGAGRHLLVADVSADVLEQVTGDLQREGYRVTPTLVDVADPASIDALVAEATRIGRLHAMVHTAGVSPRMATPEKIYAVNLLGTINVINAFLPIAVEGSVGVVMSSNAAYYAPVPLEVERILALGSAEEMLASVRTVPGWDTGLGAYWLAKRSNQLRVQAAAAEWGRKGARILSVSPGIISTPMIHFERDAGAPVDQTVSNVPVGRIGVSEDIAAAVAWLCGPEASFVTGTDLLVDGGMMGALKWSGMTTEDPQSAAGQVPGPRES